MPLFIHNILNKCKIVLQKRVYCKLQQCKKMLRLIGAYGGPDKRALQPTRKGGTYEFQRMDF